MIYLWLNCTTGSASTSLMSICFPLRTTSGCFCCISQPQWEKKNPFRALCGSASVSLYLWWTRWSRTQSNIVFYTNIHHNQIIEMKTKLVSLTIDHMIYLYRLWQTRCCRILIVSRSLDSSSWWRWTASVAQRLLLRPCRCSSLVTGSWSESQHPRQLELYTATWGSHQGKDWRLHWYATFP